MDKNLKLTYNGNACPAIGSDEKECPPLIYNGQVYLPVNFFNGKGGLTIDVDNNTICVQTKQSSPTPEILKKPNIYLYTAHKQDVTIKLTFVGTIVAAYSAYNSQLGGWQVTAFPDGKIINQADHKEYSYLFWEGILLSTNEVFRCLCTLFPFANIKQNVLRRPYFYYTTRFKYSKKLEPLGSFLFEG